MSPASAMAEQFPASDAKAFDTLRARAALAGYTCGCTAEGWIVIRSFGMSAVFDTLADASNWIHRRTGVAP